MKRYLSVKEAASLLRVSTNTIYTYLKEGKITSRRIGRGRIKIPYNELAPFIEANQPELHEDTLKIQPQPVIFQNGGSVTNGHTEEAAHSVIEQEPITIEHTEPVSVHQQVTFIPEKHIAETFEDGTENDIVAGVNDIYFYRLFKSFSFIGLGVLYLLTSFPVFDFSGSMFEEISNIVAMILPFALIGTGIMILFEVIKSRVFEKHHLLIDIFAAIVLSVYVFVSFNAGFYGRAIFATAFAGVAIGHILHFSLGNKDGSFQNSILRYSLYTALLSGILLVVRPDLFPMSSLALLIEENKGVFIFVWYLFIATPLVFFLSPFGRQSVMRLPYMLGVGVLALIMATQLTLTGDWDLAYLIYLASVFKIFCAWWGVSGFRIDQHKYKFMTLAFGWVAVSLMFGLYALRSSIESLKHEEEKRMDSVLTQVTDKLNSDFTNQTAVLTSFAGNPQTVSVIKEGDSEQAIEYAKTIFDKTENAQRVLIYNEEGIAVGVYPRNTIAQGTNFSSRDYFQKTKNTYKGYITPVFETVAGTKTVLQTEPVFEGDRMIGMIGVGLSLESLSRFYENYSLPEYKIRVIDENGEVVIDTETYKNTHLPSDLEFDFFKPKPNSFLITSDQDVRVPRWEVSIKSDASVLISNNSDINIIFSIILFINAVISIAVGLIFSQTGKIAHPENKPVLVPRLVSPQVT